MLLLAMPSGGSCQTKSQRHCCHIRVPTHGCTPASLGPSEGAGRTPEQRAAGGSGAVLRGGGGGRDARWRAACVACACCCSRGHLCGFVLCGLPARCLAGGSGLCVHACMHCWAAHQGCSRRLGCCCTAPAHASRRPTWFALMCAQAVLLCAAAEVCCKRQAGSALCWAVLCRASMCFHSSGVADGGPHMAAAAAAAVGGVAPWAS